MATKPKTTESPAPVQDASLETMLSSALEQLNGGNLKAALAAFAALQDAAIRQDAFRMGRTAQGYLKAVQERLDSADAPVPQTAELTVQLELNHHAPEEALAKVEEGLKAHPEHAGLHYLKAVALAQLDQAQPAAEALTRATSLEPGFLYQFRLETDFDGVRHSAAFAAFNRG